MKEYCYPTSNSTIQLKYYYQVDSLKKKKKTLELREFKLF
jgi:hypothetical protein